MVSRSRVDRAADNFSKGQESVDDFRAVREFRDARLAIIELFLDEVHKCSLETTIAVAGRLKRLTSIVRKCRLSRTRISALDDLVGFRIVVADLDAQTDVVASLAASSAFSRIRDYVREPRADGYRAVHVVHEYGDGADRGRVEVQIRTVWQHIWANASEGFGLTVKAGGGPPAVREYLGKLSHSTSERDETRESIVEWRQGVADFGTPRVAILDTKRRAVRYINSYASLDLAINALAIRERTDSLDAVLLLAESDSVIRITHVGLFPKDLLRILARVPPPLNIENTRYLLNPA